MPLDDEEKQTLKRQGFFYLVVGFSSAGIELVLFQLLYEFLGLPVEVSNVIAVVTSTTFNFVMNYNVTFKTAKNPVRSLVLYLLLFAFNTTFSTLTISALVSAGLHSMLAKLFTMACIVSWNFILYRKVIFK